ncbi:hypothetical protein PR048_024554 [Dryococelus australis]|uniref:Uncharacterized protein n=1 Tax=Dryococelus australis TaxID=614101 RepID=A0ABQ9GNV7_9NEOP|nr:hypothetical protein PR048_024554 [Dryococelus australis]
MHPGSPPALPGLLTVRSGSPPPTAPSLALVAPSTRLTHGEEVIRHKLYDEPGRKDGPVKEDFRVFDFAPRTTRCLVFGEPILREECYWLRILARFWFCTHLRRSGPQRTSSLSNIRRCAVHGEIIKGVGAAVAQWLGLSPPHHGDPGSIPGGPTAGFSHVGIALDDAACQRVFSGYSPFTPPLPSSAVPFWGLTYGSQLESPSLGECCLALDGKIARRLSALLVRVTKHVVAYHSSLSRYVPSQRILQRGSGTLCAFTQLPLRRGGPGSARSINTAVGGGEFRKKPLAAVMSSRQPRRTFRGARICAGACRDVVNTPGRRSPQAGLPKPRAGSSFPGFLGGTSPSIHVERRNSRVYRA